MRMKRHWRSVKRRLELIKCLTLASLIMWAIPVLSETHPENQQLFVDPDFPSIRYYYSTHAGRTDSEVCITRVDVSSDVKDPVDITPGSYAGFWKLRVVKIGPNAFSGCRKIRSITLPNGLISIGAQAFYNCSELESVTASLANNTIIGYGAFSACGKLKSITCGTSTVCDNAFRGCSALSALQIGDVSTIGECAFEGCLQLTDLEFQTGLTAVGDKAFSGCTSLTSIIYNGARPSCTSGIYAGTREDLVTIAGNTANGWPTTSITWMGRPFQFIGLNACCYGPTTNVGTPVVLTSTSGAGYTTYYTTDGHVPGSSESQTFECAAGRAEFMIDSDTVVRAVLKKDEMTTLLSKSFSFSSLATPPVFVVTDKGNDGKLMTLQTSRSGQEVYYSIGSEELTIDAHKYVAPIVISSNATISAFSVQAGSRSSYAVTTSLVCAVSNPVISSTGFNGTSYEVEIACATSDSKIHYTINGSTPTANSPVYTGAFRLSEDATVKAIAVRNGWHDSAITTKSFVTSLSALVVDSIGIRKVDTWNELLVLDYSLSLDVETGGSKSYIEARLTDNITGRSYVSSSDAYLSDCGMSKGTHSVLWHTKIDNTTFSSDDVSIEFSIVSIDKARVKTVLQCATSPKRFSVNTVPQSICVDSTEAVALSGDINWTTNSLSGDEIVFSIDGSDIARAVDASSVDLRPQHFGSNHVECCVLNNGARIVPPLSVYLNSTNGPEVVITPGTDTIFSSYQKVTILSTEPDAVVHYTLDGSVPTAASPVFTKRNITTKTVLTAVAIRPDGYVGRPASVSYALGKCDPPKIYPDDISYFESGDIEVSIEAAEGDDIFYTLNGEDPVTCGELYDGPFQVSGNTTIRAIAVNSTFLCSEVTSVSYHRITATPLICAGSTFVGESEDVEILCEDSGAEIYYTVDGSAPTPTDGIRYSGKFKVFDTTKIRAIAIADGFDVSRESSYEICALYPPSGANNVITDFNVAYDGIFRNAFYGSYTIEGSTNATNTTAFIYAIYKGITNRLMSAGLASVATAGTHVFTWIPQNDGFGFDAVENLQFVVQLKASSSTAPHPSDSRFYSEWKRYPLLSPLGFPCWTLTSPIWNNGSLDSWLSASIKVEQQGDVSTFCKCRWADSSLGKFPERISIWKTGSSILFETENSLTITTGFSNNFSLSADDTLTIALFRSKTSLVLDCVDGRYLISFGGDADRIDNQAGKLRGSNPVTIENFSQDGLSRNLYVGETLSIPLLPWWREGVSESLFINGEVVFSTQEPCEYAFTPMASGVYSIQVKRVTKEGRTASSTGSLTVEGPVVNLDGNYDTTFVYSQAIGLVCSNTDAKIYYTLDASIPTIESCEYTHPIVLTDTALVTACAIFSNGARGAVSQWTFERRKTISDILQMPQQRLLQDDDAPWMEDDQVTFSDKPSLRSGNIVDLQSSVLSTHFALKEAGVIKFYWKASCEDDPDFDDWDYGVFMLNGEEVCRIDGETDWVPVRAELPAGEYDAQWIYRKDESDDPSFSGDDCVWVAKLEIGTPATVVFDDGENVISNETAIGCVPIVPDAPHRQWFCFERWDGDVSKPIVSNTTFKAVWEYAVHTVNFSIDENCRRMGGGELSQLVGHECFVVEPVIDPGKGRRFVGWEGDVAAPVTSNSQFFAKLEYDGVGGRVGPLTWIIIEESGELFFLGSGAIPSDAYQSWLQYSDRIKCIVVPDTITAIGAHAFMNVSNVTNVELAASVKSIGEGAFSGCSSIISMTLPFVGSKRGDEYRSGAEKLFGYIFGNSSYAGGMAVSQGGGTYYIPESLRVVNITEEIIIGMSAFSNCCGINSVTIPKSVIQIERNAFKNCQGLGNGVVIQDGCVLTVNDAYPNDVVLPDGVRLMAEGVFQGCDRLMSIKIPASVTNIDGAAFSGCSSITNMVLPFVGTKPGCAGTTESLFGAIFDYGYSGTTLNGQTKQWCSRDVYANFKIPKSLKTVTILGGGKIGYGAFYNCSSLTVVTIGGGVTEVGTYAFCNCTDLTDVVLADGLTEIGDYAFYGCSALNAISIPTSVMKIGIRPFYGCKRLGTGTVIRDNCVLSVSDDIAGDVVLPLGVRLVAGEAFKGCKAMRSVVLPNSVVSVGCAAFAECAGLTNMVLPFVGGRRDCIGTTESFFGYVFGTGSYTGGRKTNQKFYLGSDSRTCYIPSSLRTVTITDAAEIGPSSFYNCGMLTSITMSSNVTNIGNCAFGQCTGLLAMEIPNGVAQIGHSAFYECSGLTSMTIPIGVSSIAQSLFAGCSKLQSVRIPNSVTIVNSFAFEVCQKLRFVTIPYSVQQIKSNAFRLCDNLAIVSVSTGDTARVQGMYSWPQNVSFFEGDIPAIVDDADSTVRADGTGGLIVKPSAGNSSVEVVMPEGCDASKITVELSSKVASVKPHGAKVSIVNGVDNITEFLDIPEADANGVIDLTKVAVKEEYVEETMDPAKGAEIKLNAANPTLITPTTRVGLFYQLREGTTLDGMSNGDSTIGDGNPWKPEIKVKGGNSAFYSIGVGKGE